MNDTTLLRFRKAIRNSTDSSLVDIVRATALQDGHIAVRCDFGFGPAHPLWTSLSFKLGLRLERRGPDSLAFLPRRV